MSSSSSGQWRPAREDFLFSPRLLEHRCHQQETQIQSKDDDDEDEDEYDIGANKYASGDDSRIGVPCVSHISASGVVTQQSHQGIITKFRAQVAGVVMKP